MRQWRSIGYRVQLETPIGDGASSALPGAGAGSTLVLIRIENDGSEGIARGDYDGPESDEGFGLTAVFSNRTISSVSVSLTHRSHLVGHLMSLDGRVPSVDDLQHGDYTYSFREIEYAYTYGQPPTNSLASSFLMYLTRTVGQGVIRTHGHLPCHSPGVERLCADPGL